MNELSRALSLAVLGCLMMAAGCSSYHSNIANEDLSQKRLLEPILVLPPVSSNPTLKSYCASLGMDFSVEVARVIEKGQVIYGPDIKTLDAALTWNNLILNGEFNADEMAAMAKHANCKSVLGIELRDIRHYPPMRTVIYMTWFDAETGDVIAKVYNDVDMTDWKTERIYGNYIGYGPAKMLEEQFRYSEDSLHTASLSPERFRQFVAAYSVNLMFGKAQVGWWYRFWNALA